MMTLSLPSPEPATARSGAALLVPAFGLGIGCVALAWVASWALGLAPASAVSWTTFGAGAAVAAAGLAMVWHALTLRAGGRAETGAVAAFRLQALLAGSLLVKLATLVIAVLALARSGTKFEDVAAFAVAFAAASLVFQVVAAAYLARPRGRPSHGQAAAPPGPSAKN